MSIVEATAAELRRLAESGRASFSGQHGSGDLSRYVDGLIVPPLKDALRDISERNLPSHQVVEPTVGVLQEPSDSLVQVTHYTSVRTAFALLHGTLSGEPGGSLRVYDSEHTNDPQEGAYFFRALALPSQHTWVGTATPSHAYVASFLKPSEGNDLSDDLTLWRLYGRDGKGCSLRVWVPATLLREVRYGPAINTDLRGELIALFDAVDPIAQLSEDIRNLLRGMLWEEIGSLRFLYKDEEYSGEHECRLVIPYKEVDEASVQFDYREDSESLRRYLEHPELVATELFRQSGASITIGPAAPDREELLRSFNLMKDRTSLKHRLEIKSSQRNYRPS